MMRPWILILIACLGCGNLTAQDSLGVATAGLNTTHATVVGAGKVNLLDTYLSPLEYSGPQLQFLHESLRTMRWAKGRISMQSIWQVDLSYTHNKPDKGRELGGDIGYNIGWHYNFCFGNTAERLPRLRILVGPQLAANAGFLYNTRNGNNPAQAIASLHLAASAALIFRFHLRQQPVVARYQLDLPLVGAKFSPNYGQSYYEIFSLGHTDHNVCLTHPFNAFSNRHLMTLDFPLRHTTLRVGYLCDIRQSHVNGLKYHSYTHAMLLGIVRHLTIHKPRRRQQPSPFVL